MMNSQGDRRNPKNVSEEFGLDSLRKNWFSETGTLAGDFALSIEVKDIIHREKSKFQDILVFDSKKFGRCLSLANTMQASQGNEFSYHEMMTFLPLNSHPDPKTVLVIGGGNGGMVRESSKHPSVQSITLCEIDEAVIHASKKYLPFLAEGFESPKLNVHIGDGMEFIKTKRNTFDVIITDFPGPIGPAAKLYEKSSFELLKCALKPGGVIAFEAECFWFDTHKTREFLDTCRSIFPVVDYASTLVPSFPGGQLGIMLAGTSGETNFRKPLRTFSSQTLRDLKMKYYTSDVHRASFALPISITKELGLNEEVFVF